MKLLENMKGEITVGVYLSIAEIVNSVPQIGTGALLIAKHYTSGLIWENDSIYLFSFHRKDEKIFF